MHSGYDSVFAEKGGGEAMKWVNQFLENHPLIDTIYPSDVADLAIKFVDDKYPNHVTFLPPEEKLPTSQEMGKIFRENLMSIADRLRGSLSHGSLVIKSSISWGGITIGYPHSKLKMDELIRITTTIPNLEDRIAAITKIVGNNNHTRLIAERFNINPGEEEK
jgi:hypothetical protein